MSKLFNQQSYVENGQFSGGQNVTLTTGSAFSEATDIYGGLYVGLVGNLTVKTIDGSVLTFVSASGFIPGLISAVSASSTAGSIIALR
jgi:hypothetical protein